MMEPQTQQAELTEESSVVVEMPLISRIQEDNTRQTQSHQQNDNSTMTSVPSSQTNTNLNNDDIYVSPSYINQVVKTTKSAFLTGRTKDVKFRKKQLKQLKLLVEENKTSICEALKSDLNKPEFETLLGEFNLLVNDIIEFLYLLDDFVKPEHKAKNLLTSCDQVYVQHEPLGVVLIMGAWNYPLLLALEPFAGAIAAGNCAIMKMSEHAPNIGKLMADLLPKYLDPDCYNVVNCDLATTKYMLEEHKFDHVFYTGGEFGGKAVYTTVSKTLTPVTLELGGKSPVYIDDDVIHRDAVWNRLFWGKFMNAGQTCIAPDYVLCSEKAQQAARKQFAKVIKQFYNDDPVVSQNYARIVNFQHFERLKKLLKESSIVQGGKLHPDKLSIEPAIVLDASMDDAIMQEEIFGPILPFVTCSSVQKAIDIINARPKPLALYVFSDSKKVQNKFMTQTSSGGVCINDVILHISSVGLPFGGVGCSGIGKYHGRYSLELFSNDRAVLARGFNPVLEWIGANRYPPYNNTKLTVLTLLGMNRKFYIPGPIVTNCIAFATGAFSIMAYQTFF